MGPCMQNVVGVLPMPNGVIPVKGQRLTCPSLTCTVLPAMPDHSGLEACMLVLNNTCKTVQEGSTVAYQANTCCPNDAMGSTVLEMGPAWYNYRDFAVDNSYTVNFWGELTVTVPAFAYTRRGTAVAVFDMAYTPSMVPSPARYAMISSVGVMVFQDIPSKPITISYDVKRYLDSILDTRVAPYPRNTECGRRQVVANSELAVFYYEKAVSKWLSVSQGHSYNQTSGVVTAVMQPDILARNDLVLFVGVMLGIPRDTATAAGELPQYTLSSVGIQPQEVFRARWKSTGTLAGEECIFPIPINATELALMSKQGLTALGSPYLLKVPAEELAGSRSAVLPMPPADTQYFEYAAASLSQAGGGRRLLQQQDLQATNVERYLINLTVPSFFNTTSKLWQDLPNCTFDNATRAYVCHLTESFIRQNGLQVMYVNTVKTINLQMPDSTPPPTRHGVAPPLASPSLPPSTTPVHEKADNNNNASGLVVGLVCVVLLVVSVVAFLTRRLFCVPKKAAAPAAAQGASVLGPQTVLVHSSHQTVHKFDARYSARNVEIPELDADINEFLRTCAGKLH